MAFEKGKNPSEGSEGSVGMSPSEFRWILDHLEDWLMVLDGKGVLRYWNEPSARRFGTPDSHFLGRPFSDLVHAEDSPQITGTIGLFLKDGSSLPGMALPEIRFRIRDAEGSWWPCIAQARVIRPPEDADRLCLLHVREDRERRKLEPWRERVHELQEEMEAKSRKLAESKAEYSSLIETMNDGFWVLDAQGTILFANEKLADLLGFAASELVGMSAFELFDEGNIELFVEQVLERMQAKVGSYEIEMTRKDGQRITCLIRSAPRFNAQGQFVGILANITDISVRKRLEDRLRSSESNYRDLFDNMQDVVCRIDAEGGIRAMNRAGARILGYERPEDVLGRKIKSFYSSRSEWKRFESELGEKGFLEDYIVQLRRKDGQVVAMSVNAHLLLDEKGWPSGIDGVFRDVSERARMEDQLHKYASDLEKKNQELESLIYSITHDLKSPLLVAGGMVSRLQRVAASCLDEKGQKYLEWIRINVNKMEKMVGDLLEFYRADKSLVPFETVSTASLVDTVIRDVEPLAREKGIVVRKAGPFPVVKGHWNRLYQVLYNLVENAVKFTDQTMDAVVEIGCRMGEKEHLFRVKDSGPGIPPEHQSKVFQIFYTLEPEHASGTGIGLSIAKKIILNHGGRIWVESEQGEGATFCFTLPAIGSG